MTIPDCRRPEFDPYYSMPRFLKDSSISFARTPWRDDESAAEIEELM